MAAPSAEGMMRLPANDDQQVVVGDRFAVVGETGLLGRSGHTPVGYFGDREKTAEVFRTIERRLWTLSGDQGRLDADGMITLFGRRIDVHQYRRRESLPRRGRKRAPRTSRHSRCGCRRPFPRTLGRSGGSNSLADRWSSKTRHERRARISPGSAGRLQMPERSYRGRRGKTVASRQAGLQVGQGDCREFVRLSAKLIRPDNPH